MKTETIRQAIGDRCPALASLTTAIDAGFALYSESQDTYYFKGLYETDCRYMLGLAALYPEFVSALVTHDLRGGAIRHMARLVEEIRLGN